MPQVGARSRSRSSGPVRSCSSSPSQVAAQHRPESRSRRCSREEEARRSATTALQAPDAAYPLVRLLSEGSRYGRLEAAGCLAELAGNGDEDDLTEIVDAGVVAPAVRMLVDASTDRR